MKMQMCVRCKKRPAMVFISKSENGKTVNEGLCIPCARELGIHQVTDILDKFGVSDEDIDAMTQEAESLLDSLPDALENDDELSENNGRAPALDLAKIFSNLNARENDEENDKKQDKKPRQKKQKAKFLQTYCQNLTQKAADGRIDRIVGRDRELARLIQILCRRQKNNPCLIGDPGVGKTAIAEALAQRIAAGDVPYKLQNKEVWLVDLTALVAGTQFRGQFESRVLGLLSEVKELGNVILVIDEVHKIVGAGESEGSMNAANILKPALSRGEIQVIGATTLKEYRKYIEKDSALERRFQPVTVNEPSLQDTVEMLRCIKGYYESYHCIRIPEDVLYAAVQLSERYLTDRYLPDKAIDLLDEAASAISLSSPALNKKRKIADELIALAEERQTIEAMEEKEGEENEEKYKLLADLHVRELNLINEQTAVAEECATLTVTVADLAKVVEVWTGVPASTVNANEFEKIIGLEEQLKESIIGQDHAVSTVVRAIKRKRAGVCVRRAPVSFIFAGPTGVGKTELVRVLARMLFDQPESLIRLDMSEFMEKHSVSRIIGAPPGYVGYDEAGQLTEKIRRRPYSVILFDEIEKAHPDVLNILLQVLDAGQLTDASGRTVNFENTVIIMTTNAGSDSASAVIGFSERNDSRAEEKTERALLGFLRPEFINRVDGIITFRHLSIDDFGRIALIMLGQLRDVLAERGINLKWDEEATALLAKESYSEKFGARNMRRYMETAVEDKIAEQIIVRYGEAVTEIRLSGKTGKLEVISL